MLKKTLFALIFLVLLLASCGGGSMATPEFASDRLFLRRISNNRSRAHGSRTLR